VVCNGDADHVGVRFNIGAYLRYLRNAGRQEADTLICLGATGHVAKKHAGNVAAAATPDAFSLNSRILRGPSPNAGLL